MFKKWTKLTCCGIAITLGFICFPLLAREDSSDLTEKDKEIIKQLIDIGYRKTIDEFYEEIDYLSQIESNCRKMDPLKLLEFVFSNPELCQQVEDIFNTETKANLAEVLIEIEVKKTRQSGELVERIESLADLLNRDKNIIENLINLKNYKELFTYLIQS